MAEDIIANEVPKLEEPLSEEEAFKQNLINLCENRSATYGFLSRLYRVEIDQALLDTMHATRYPAATGNPDADEGYYLIAKSLSNLTPSALTELAVDYSRTFIGNSNDMSGAAFPYESFYTSEKHLLMQAARDEVLAIYRAYGYDKSETWAESEDHAAVELEFMQLMSHRVANAVRKDRLDAAYKMLAVQQGFLSEHMLTWMPMLTSDMQKFTKTMMYKGLALLTIGFLETEREFLDDVLADANKDE